MERQTRELRSFTALAYLLTWVLLAPWFYLFNVVYHQEIPRWMWALVPLAFIGGWGPSLAALIVTALDGGRMAVRQILGSLIIWRVPVLWYLAVFLLPPLLTTGSLLIVDRGVSTLSRFDLAAFLANAPIVYALALPFGPLGEELGWRGFALPRLLSRFGPVMASLVIGIFWTFWHIPMMVSVFYATFDRIRYHLLRANHLDHRNDDSFVPSDLRKRTSSCIGPLGI